MEKMDLENELNIAFKKLKGAIYYDKTQLITRNKLVAFESEGNIKDKIKKISEKISGDDWEAYSQKLLKQIKCLVYPKTARIKESENEIYLNNQEHEEITIENQYMFDSSVETQIIGVLWIMLIGVYLDESLSDSVFGNRLRKSMLNKQKYKKSPHLLKPYFQQYESWRDYGLLEAEKCLERGIDSLILTLDLKRFFYSVSMFEEHFESFIDIEKYPDDEDLKICIKINKFIWQVISVYTKELKSIVKDDNSFELIERSACLPIGFLPSTILSNWYLKDFDKEIFDSVRPLYYGRYVDDIILVFDVPKTSFLYNLKLNNKLKKDEVIKHIFSNKSKGKNLIIETQKIYNLNSKFIPCNTKTNLQFQDEKINIYYFDNHGSRTLLNTFRDNIHKNKSEFRFLPTDGQYFMSQNLSGIYDLQKDNNSSDNKFRDIKDITLNKFNLSKLIGKKSKVLKLVNDKTEVCFENDILMIFDNVCILNNFIFIETILSLFINNKSYKNAYKFCENVLRAINLEIVNEKIKYYLFEHFNSSLIRTLCLTYNPDIKKLIQKLEKKLDDTLFKKQIVVGISSGDLYSDFVNKYRSYYLKTKMYNKYSVSFMIENILVDNEIIDDENNCIDFTDFRLCLEKIPKDCEPIPTYDYYPYIVKLQDIEMYQNIKVIARGEYILFDKDCLKYTLETYYRLNFQSDITSNIESNIKRIELKINDYNKTYATYTRILNTNIDAKPTISIVNAELAMKNLEDNILNKPNRSINRYNKLSSCINKAIDDNSNIVIMPECYVPFEWLPFLASKAAQNKICIITGVEHVLASDKAVNLTAVITPFSVDEDITEAHISLRNKVHYSPDEIDIITGYNKKVEEGTTYELYCYNDFWFTVYCCFELASVKDRIIFADYVDAIFAVEYNRDTKYFSNIIESLSRDVHCYCIQANNSKYGDSRIVAPSKTDVKDLVMVKGGETDIVLTQSIDVKSLRDFEIKEYNLQKSDKRFKVTPPNFNRKTVMKKINKSLFKELEIKNM